MNAFEFLEWIIQNKTCICGGELKEIREGLLQCERCGFTIHIVGADKIEEA